MEPHRRSEGDLLRAGYHVVRVQTQLMAAARRGGRRPGKSDPIDAEAGALAALRHPDLPTAHLDGRAGSGEEDQPRGDAAEHEVDQAQWHDAGHARGTPLGTMSGQVKRG